MDVSSASKAELAAYFANAPLITAKHDHEKLSRIYSGKRSVAIPEVKELLPAILVSGLFEMKEYVSTAPAHAEHPWYFTISSVHGFPVVGSGVQEGTSDLTTPKDTIVCVSGVKNKWHVHFTDEATIADMLSAGRLVYKRPVL